MAEQNTVTQPSEKEFQVCTLRELLETAPLHSSRKIRVFFSQPQHGTVAYPESIWMHCDQEKCNGIRRYSKHGDGKFELGQKVRFHTVIYACSNCTMAAKVFVLKSVQQDEEQPYVGICAKIYQEPQFGSPIPKNLFEIIGQENREHFLQARRSIARGLGIGAYGYYRRIVENNKFNLVASILKIAQDTKSPPEQIDLLKTAQIERQFSKAIETLRGAAAIPAILLIDGHNHLALLHDALSSGIHELSDAECLERAQESEVILCEIATRMQMAMTEQKNVKAALSSMLKRKAAV